MPRLQGTVRSDSTDPALSLWECPFLLSQVANKAVPEQLQERLEHKAEDNNCRLRSPEPDVRALSHDFGCFTTSEGSKNDSFAKRLHGQTRQSVVR
jgi:hypothetical protein